MSGGLGACGYGNASYGYGDVPVGNSSTAALLKKTDGTQGDAAYIDPTTGDFVLDANGNKVGWDSLDQMVYLALATTLGSSAVTTLGIALPSGLITPNIATQNQNAVYAALKSLTDQNLITILSVVTLRQPNPDGLRLQVGWQSVSTGQIQKTFV